VYAALSAGDVEAALSNFDESIEWWTAGTSTIGGTYRSKAEVLEMLGKLAEKSMTTTPDRFLADGDDVVVLTQVTAGGKSWPGVDVLTLRGGKIVKGRSFGDTALLEKVVGTK
jgi:uncharacterized protein